MKWCLQQKGENLWLKVRFYFFFTHTHTHTQIVHIFILKVERKLETVYDYPHDAFYPHDAYYRS